MTEQWQPWKWTVPQGGVDGKRHLSRQDGRDRVSGQAVYTRDVYLPGMLYAKILTSPYAHSKIVRMDTSRAAKLEGVRDILRYDDPDIARDNVTGPYVSNAFNILTLPEVSDYPAVACILNESHLGYSSYGACGVGEGAGASMPGITCGAVYNAIGKWVFDFPITPDRVLKALGKI